MAWTPQQEQKTRAADCERGSALQWSSYSAGFCPIPIGCCAFTHKTQSSPLYHCFRMGVQEISVITRVQLPWIQHFLLKPPKQQKPPKPEQDRRQELPTFQMRCTDFSIKAQKAKLAQGYNTHGQMLAFVLPICSDTCVCFPLPNPSELTTLHCTKAKLDTQVLRLHSTAAQIKDCNGRAGTCTQHRYRWIIWLETHRGKTWCLRNAFSFGFMSRKKHFQKEQSRCFKTSVPLK